MSPELNRVLSHPRIRAVLVYYFLEGAGCGSTWYLLHVSPGLFSEFRAPVQTIDILAINNTTPMYVIQIVRSGFRIIPAVRNLEILGAVQVSSGLGANFVARISPELPNEYVSGLPRDPECRPTNEFKRPGIQAIGFLSLSSSE